MESKLIRKVEMICPVCGLRHEVEERTHLAMTVVRGKNTKYEEKFYLCGDKVFFTEELDDENEVNARKAYDDDWHKKYPNLQDIRDLPPEKQAEIHRKSVEANKRKAIQRKTLRQELLMLLSKGDTQERMCLSLIEAAMDGNASAFQTVRDTIGEKPVDVSINVSSDDTDARELAYEEAKKALGLE